MKVYIWTRSLQCTRTIGWRILHEKSISVSGLSCFFCIAASVCGCGERLAPACLESLWSQRFVQNHLCGSNINWHAVIFAARIGKDTPQRGRGGVHSVGGKMRVGSNDPNRSAKSSPPKDIWMDIWRLCACFHTQILASGKYRPLHFKDTV